MRKIKVVEDLKPHQVRNNIDSVITLYSQKDIAKVVPVQLYVLISIISQPKLKSKNTIQKFKIKYRLN